MDHPKDYSLFGLGLWWPKYIHKQPALFLFVHLLFFRCRFPGFTPSTPWKLTYHWNIPMFNRKYILKNFKMVDFPASHVSLRGGRYHPCAGPRSLVRIFVQERFALLPPCHTILALQALHRALVIGQGAWFPWESLELVFLKIFTNKHGE